MATTTERLAADLPLAAIPVATEVSTMSGGKVGGNFADLHGTRGKDASKPREPNTAVNEDQHELLADVKEAWEQVEAQGGVVPATLLNMHPWQMKATGPLNEGIVIPSCPIKDEFVQFVQRSPRFDFGDRWGKFKVRMIWPVSIMQDFKRQHYTWGGSEKAWGGVVVYMGDHAPGQIKVKTNSFFDQVATLLHKLSDGEVKKQLEDAIELQRRELLENNERFGDKILSTKEIAELMARARELQIMAYEDAFEKAEQSMVSYLANQKGAGYPITSYQRAAAQWLFERKYIKKLPGWITEKRVRGWTPNSCPKCGTEIGDVGYACGKCGRIVKPFEAFKDGEIKRDNPAMQRCTRAQLDELGLRDVLTLEEELAQGKEPDDEKKTRKPKA